jgi:galactokinase
MSGVARERVFRAPGRANLIGEHTDHTDGLVLPVAIDRAVTLRGVVGGDRIRLRSAQADGEVDVAADGSQTPPGGWGRFVAAVAAELGAGAGARRLRRPPVARTCRRGPGCPPRRRWRSYWPSRLAASADLHLEPLELAALGRRAEHRAVGVPSGIMDQAASVLGRADHAVMLDCGTLEHRLVPLPADHVLL